MENINVIDSEKTLVVTQSNNLLEARYSLTVGEQCLLLAMTSFIHPDDEDFKPYVIKAKDLAFYLNIDEKNFYREVDKITDRLMKRILYINLLDGSVLKTHWVSEARHEKGQVTLSFSPTLKPYLLQLKERFTQYNLSNVVRFNSIYTIRIYGLLKQYERFGKREIDLEELKNILDIQEEYREFKRFRARVLNQAKKEFEEKNEDGTFKSDITFELETIRTERKITRLRFLIKQQKKQDILLSKNEQIEVLSHIEQLKYYGISQQLAEAVLEEKGEQFIIECIDIYEKQLEKGNVKDTSGAYLASLLHKVVGKSDFERKREEQVKQKAETQKKQKEEQKKIETLKEEFSEFQKERIENITSKLSPQEKNQLRTEFEMQGMTSNFEQQQYKKSGLRSAIVKASYRRFLREKYLSENERDFVVWADEKGYQIELMEGADNEYTFS